MRNILDFLAATAVIFTLGAAPASAQAVSDARPVPAKLVGRWVRDGQGAVVGSVWAIKGDRVVMLTGPAAGFVPGNQLVELPLNDVIQTAQGVTLSNAGLASLAMKRRVG